MRSQPHTLLKRIMILQRQRQRAWARLRQYRYSHPSGHRPTTDAAPVRQYIHVCMQLQKAEARLLKLVLDQHPSTRDAA